MRGVTRGWAVALTAVTVAAGLAGCTGSGDGDGKAATRSSAPAVAKACANGSFTWTGVKKTDRLTGVSAPEPSRGRTIRTTNPIERVYTPKPSVRTEGPALPPAEVLFSLGKKIGEIDSDAATLADVNGDTWAFTDVHQKAPNLDSRFSEVSDPGETVQYAGVREWEGDFRHTCPGGRTTTGHARNWTVDLQGILSCDEYVDSGIARQAARLSCEPGSPATRNT
ncbi:hypothetical protein ACFY1U_08615 [Streptomyces sp. NPDC001351]|uniref:hypothetical protein n=1 Tax=Streptomyces sp. NPDC001351 TaxID=3364564 RepID=UPI0036D15733